MISLVRLCDIFFELIDISILSSTFVMRVRTVLLTVQYFSIFGLPGIFPFIFWIYILSTFVTKLCHIVYDFWNCMRSIHSIIRFRIIARTFVYYACCNVGIILSQKCAIFLITLKVLMIDDIVSHIFNELFKCSDISLLLFTLVLFTWLHCLAGVNFLLDLMCSVSLLSFFFNIFRCCYHLYWAN